MDETVRMTPARSVALSTADLPDLQRLAQACLDQDGGLPLFAEEAMVRSRVLRDRTIGFRLPDGSLAAAAGLGFRAETAVTTGMVDPASRGRGIGEQLLRWAIEQGGEAALMVETESCSADADALYARHGLVRTFAETVMCHDMQVVPSVAVPDGVQVEPVSSATEQDLFAAYRGSFADRPGFIEPEAEEWLTELREDDEWRRDLSRVACDAQGVPVGFVNVLGTWLDQVGVVPEWRGRRLGAFLVADTLLSLWDEGVEQVWLCVNVNNPAEDLYRKLGFISYGMRARYVRPGTPAA